MPGSDVKYQILPRPGVPIDSYEVELPVPSRAFDARPLAAPALNPPAFLLPQVTRSWDTSLGSHWLLCGRL